MNLREQIKSLLDEQVSGKHVESLTDKIINLVVQTDPNLSDAASLFKMIELWEKKLSAVDTRVGGLETNWNQVQNAFAPLAPTPIPAPAPLPPTIPISISTTPQFTPVHATVTGSNVNKYLSDKEFEFFRDHCVLEKDDIQKAVTSIRAHRSKEAFTLDGAAFRIVVEKGGKQRRYNKMKLYTSLYENTSPQV